MKYSIKEKVPKQKYRMHLREDLPIIIVLIPVTYWSLSSDLGHNLVAAFLCITVIIGIIHSALEKSAELSNGIIHPLLEKFREFVSAMAFLSLVATGIILVFNII